MVEIKYGDEKHSIKSDINEFTIKEYEIINHFLNEEGDFFDKWFNILEFLGLPRLIIEDIDANELVDIINSINISEVEPCFIKEIEIDGYLYKVDLNDKGEPKITGKVMKYLEKVCKKKYYISDIMSILFKRIDLGDKEHYEMAHIEYKAELFRNQNASISLPYLLFIADRYVKNISSLK